MSVELVDIAKCEELARKLGESSDPTKRLAGLVLINSAMLGHLTIAMDKLLKHLESVLGEQPTESATTPTCESTDVCAGCGRPRPKTAADIRAANAERQRRYRARKRDPQ